MKETTYEKLVKEATHNYSPFLLDKVCEKMYQAVLNDEITMQEYKQLYDIIYEDKAVLRGANRLNWIEADERRSKKGKLYYEENREEKLAYQNDYYLKNKEKMRKYYQENKERL